MFDSANYALYLSVDALVTIFVDFRGAEPLCYREYEEDYAPFDEGHVAIVGVAANDIQWHPNILAYSKSKTCQATLLRILYYRYILHATGSPEVYIEQQ